jgi:hypothetical protein
MNTELAIILVATLSASLFTSSPLFSAQETNEVAKSPTTPITPIISVNPVESAASTVQGINSALKTEAKEKAQNDKLYIRSKNKGESPKDFLFQMGERLHIEATGETAQKMKSDLEKTGASRTPILFLDGVKMTSLPVVVSWNENGKILLFSFDLDRNSSIKESREEWDMFFKKKIGYEMTIDEIMLAVSNEWPLVVQSASPIRFCVAPTTRILLTIGGALLILITTYYLIVNKTNMLKDESTGNYSLGKSQMAFWGLLVALAFVGVWILTATMEYVPQQVLILLGISGATGLSAILIGNTKKSEMQDEIIKLQQEQQKLQEQKAKNPPSFLPEDENRLAAIPLKIDELARQLGNQNENTAQSNGFWRDICNDGNGVSFHRLQVVIWTLILGVVFIQSVADGMSMPEFPETLLTLMGISNLTYLGFKIPEK